MGKHVQQDPRTKSAINAIGSPNYIPQFLYFATDTGEFAYGLTGGGLSAWINPATIGGTYTFNSTATVQLVNASGTITANAKLDPASDNDLAATANGLYSKKMTVAAGSASRLSIDTNNVITMSALSIVNTTTDTTSTSLTAALTAAGYASGNLVFQNSDMLILTAATGGTEVWLHTGGTAGTVADFVKLESPDLSAAYIRSLVSGTAPITYNSATGAFGLTFENALQIVSGKLVLGGALTQDTTLSGAFNFLFNLGSTKGVTLGATAGPSRLNVDGDLEVTDNTKGLILKNGSARWRVTVASDGSLTTTSI